MSESVNTRSNDDSHSVGTLEQSDPILSARDVSVRFDMERGQSRVLNSVDIDIGRQEILGIVGESGSGKSMFASALLDAVVDPGKLSGEITYTPGDGRNPIDILSLSKGETKKLRWEDISMVFQGAMSAFNPTKRIRGHFEETLKAHNYDVEAGMDRARELLSDLHLDPDRVLSSYPHELSGGMSQRALIALSLVLEPEVLVMDEPTAALDLLMQRSIINLLEELKEKYDLTLVFITHDLELVANIADRIAVLYGFEFVEVGTASDIVRNASHPYTRALINSTPNLDAPLDEMKPIEGSSPDPVNIPSGCSYHPRCPMADHQCETSDPDFFETDGEEHFSACFYADRVDDYIPLSLESKGDLEQSAGRIHSRDTDDPLVSLDDVEVHFEKENSFFGNFFQEPDTVRAVDGVALDVYENDVVALVGESGCGKTTLGKTTIGLQRPTAGTLSFHGQDVWAARDGRGDVDIPFDEIRRSLQIIHQDPGSSLNPNKTVMSSLLNPIKICHPEINVADRRSHIYGMLERVGLQPADDYAMRYPHQLSGGEKQRVALVRALLMNPDLILADEAVSALDVSLRVDMMDLMIELQDIFSTSFVFISHNLSNARYLAEHSDGRIGIMYLGQIVEIGPADKVLRNPMHPYTKALMWATPDIDPDVAEDDASPIRNIDIPDPVNPPSGCRFHTRCPVAREACKHQSPEHASPENDGHTVACFRAIEDHDYWESPEITDSVSDSEPVEADD
ncbi:peptide ABC transporter ATP-binding protein [Haladaptatus sp. R4]|uniref:ABC transporter ATP-binding protein n=1 Tax=Haladaptatus sp. R4 TaxID=1679489 RepID=UPI0007B4CC67|nr:ABC transporter ATP-binding protein [Haladaptatus sp. R4]KZN22595.1 peptide ABC transporter ATP-binding protein [Haladaptatus sp. R4]